MKYHITLIALLVSTQLVSAVDIYLVTDDPGSDPLIDYLNNNYSNVGTINAVDADGFDYSDASNQPSIGATDLVLISPDNNSGNLSSIAAEVDFFNGLSNDMIMLSSYVVRNDKWGWTNGGGQSVDSLGSETSLLTPADSLFSGISGDPVDLSLDGINPYGAFNVNVGANALATSDGKLSLARWSSGDSLATLSAGYKGSALVHGGDRIYFGLVASDPLTNLTADGQIVLTNAFEEFGLVAIPEPSQAAILIGALAVVGATWVRRDKRKKC